MAYHVYIGEAGQPQLDIEPERIENGSLEYDFAPKTRDKDTLAGKVTTAAGVFDTRGLKFNLYYEYAEDLKELAGDAYNAPTAPATHGNIIFDAGGCVTLKNMSVTLHDDCEATDDKDVTIPAAQVVLNFNMRADTDAERMVEVQVYGQPSTSGSLKLGTGNLTALSHFDVATGGTVTNA